MIEDNDDKEGINDYLRSRSVELGLYNLLNYIKQVQDERKEYCRDFVLTISIGGSNSECQNNVNVNIQSNEDSNTPMKVCEYRLIIDSLTNISEYMKKELSNLLEVKNEIDDLNKGE